MVVMRSCGFIRLLLLNRFEKVKVYLPLPIFINHIFGSSLFRVGNSDPLRECKSDRSIFRNFCCEISHARSKFIYFVQLLLN